MRDKETQESRGERLIKQVLSTTEDLGWELEDYDEKDGMAYVTISIPIEGEGILRYTFSEYDYELPDEMVDSIIEGVKESFPNIKNSVIFKHIKAVENYYYGEARAENKRGREYPSISDVNLIEEIINRITNDVIYK